MGREALEAVPLVQGTLGSGPLFSEPLQNNNGLANMAGYRTNVQKQTSSLYNSNNYETILKETPKHQ